MLKDLEVLKENEVLLRDILIGDEDYGVVDCITNKKFLISIDGDQGERYIFLSISENNKTDKNISLELIIYNNTVYIVGVRTILELDNEIIRYNFINSIEDLGLKIRRNRGGNLVMWPEIVSVVKEHFISLYIDKLLFGETNTSFFERSQEAKDYWEANFERVKKDALNNINNKNWKYKNLNNIILDQIEISDKGIAYIDIIKIFEDKEELKRIIDVLYNKRSIDNDYIMYHVLYNEIISSLKLGRRHIK